VKELEQLRVKHAAAETQIVELQNTIAKLKGEANGDIPESIGDRGAELEELEKLQAEKAEIAVDLKKAMYELEEKGKSVAELQDMIMTLKADNERLAANPAQPKEAGESAEDSAAAAETIAKQAEEIEQLKVEFATKESELLEKIGQFETKLEELTASHSDEIEKLRSELSEVIYRLRVI
jgi:chromosome segregation ATPase